MSNRIFSILMFFALQLFVFTASANVVSHKGTEFIFAIPPNYAGIASNEFEKIGVNLVIASDSNTSGTINYGDVQLRSFNISAGASVLIELGQNVQAFANSVSKQSIHIRSDHPISCLLYTSPSPRDGATSRMPSSA